MWDILNRLSSLWYASRARLNFPVTRFKLVIPETHKANPPTHQETLSHTEMDYFLSLIP